jgi:putative transposase
MRKRYSAHQKAQIVLEVLKEEQTLAQIASAHGVHPNQIRQWKAQVVEGLPNLFNDEKRALHDLKAAHAHELDELYAEIGRLTTQLAWLKKKVASNLSKAGRRALLDREAHELPLKTQAELLGLNRPGLYYRPVAPSAEEIALKHRIDALYTQYPFYGSRRITATLCRELHLELNRKAVQRHMREMGLAGICPGPNLSKRNLAQSIYPYLLRQVTASHPNHVWGIDVTYVRLQGGWMYLVAVLDWFSRYVISWELDQTLAMPFVLSAVDRALAQARPVIWNSDQGSHFTSPQYLERLLVAQVQISMDGKGRALDNIFTERLWRTVKYEDIYLRDYDSPKATRLGLSRYFAFYNHERPHQSLGYRTPAQVYFGEEEPRLQTPPAPALASPILYPEGRQCTLTTAPSVS